MNNTISTIKIKIIMGIIGVLLYPAALCLAWSVTPIKHEPYQVWLASIKDAKATTIAFSFKHGGTAFDPPDKTGLNSFMAQSLLAGAGHHSPQELQDMLAQYSIELSINATRDRLKGTMRFLPHYQDIAVSLLRDIITKPVFELQEIALIKQQILATIAYNNKRPQSIIEPLWWHHMFEGHPYSLPSLGTHDTVNIITQQDLLAHHQYIATQHNFSMAIVGNVDEQEANAIAQKLTQTMPRQHKKNYATQKNVPPFISKTNGPNIFYYPRQTTQAIIMFGVPSITPLDPLYLDSFIMNDLLGGAGLSSYLSQKIRVEQGLTYGIYTHLYPLQHASILIGQTSTNSNNLEAMLHALDAYIPQREFLTHDAVEQAITRNIGSLALRLSSSRNIASILLHYMNYGYKPSRINTIDSLLRQVTYHNITNIHQTLFPSTPCREHHNNDNETTLFSRPVFCNITMVIIAPQESYDALSPAQKKLITLHQ